MSRRTEGAASRAAEAATEAARTLAARSHEARAERAADTEPAAEEVKIEKQAPVERVEALKNERPHVKAMDDIIKRRGLEPEPEEAAPATTPAPEAAAAPQPDAVATPEAPKTVRVKVDGEEFDAPADEVEAAGGVKSFQMQRASENRLKKANETLAESRRIADLVLRQAPPPAPEKPKESDADFIAARMDVIRFGTPQEAASAQLEILQRTQQKFDPDALTQRAVAQFNHDIAVKEFDKEFQDLVTNPIRLRTVVALRQEALERHKIEKPNQPVDWNSFYRTIGNQVRSAFGGQSQPAAAPAAASGTPSPQPDKEARKASIVNLPTAAARAEAPKEEKPLSPEEERKQAIAELRRSRGQAG